MFRADRVSPVRDRGTPDPGIHRDKPPARSTDLPRRLLSVSGCTSALAGRRVERSTQAPSGRDPGDRRRVFDRPEAAGDDEAPGVSTGRAPSPTNDRAEVAGPRAAPSSSPRPDGPSPAALRCGTSATTSSVRRAPANSRLDRRPGCANQRNNTHGPQSAGGRPTLPSGPRRPGAPRATAPVEVRVRGQAVRELIIFRLFATATAIAPEQTPQRSSSSAEGDHQPQLHLGEQQRPRRTARSASRKWARAGVDIPTHAIARPDQLGVGGPSGPVQRVSGQTRRA